MRSLLSRKFLVAMAGLGTSAFIDLDQGQLLAISGIVAAYLGANVTQKKVDNAA